MRRTPFVHICLLVAFLLNTLVSVPVLQAQQIVLPAPGAMVHLSPAINPPILKGIKVNPNNPFRFEFILDRGDSVETRHASSLQDESTRLIKYFLASLTIPEKDLWVNLSPYEKDRIIPDSFGLTEMGRDLLAQDYMLKQVTASLIYPEDEVGKKFWKRVYEEAAKKYGNTNIPVNTFNKVWIVPEKAVVYENAKAGTAYVVESRLKVMLEADYLSMSKHSNDLSSLPAGRQGSGTTNELGSQIVREIVIPELTKEINEGANFAQLRQVYNSLILATWYKKKIKGSILSQVYADRNKIAGVEINHVGDGPRAVRNQGDHRGSPVQDVNSIYQQYLQAFKKGVYNYIKEEPVPGTSERIPKKYFSGGFDAALISPALESAPKNWSPESSDRNFLVSADLAMESEATDQAMKASETLYGEIKWGWDNILKLVEKAHQDESRRKEIIANIIVLLRLKGGTGDEKYFSGMNDIGKDSRRRMLIDLLGNSDIPFYMKRLLLKNFPRGEVVDYNAVKGLAVDLEQTAKVKGLAKPRTGLVGRIRSDIHDEPSSLEEHLAAVTAYARFVESDGREGGLELKKMGYEISKNDVTWKDNLLKPDILKACDELLVVLEQINSGAAADHEIGKAKRLARDLEDEVEGGSYRIEKTLAQQIHENIRSQVSSRKSFVDVLRAYKKFIESDGEDAADLKRLGYKVKKDRDVTWTKIPDKGAILKICNEMIIALQRLNDPTKAGLNIKAFINVYVTEFLSPDERKDVIDQMEHIVGQEAYSLKDLEVLIEIRQWMGARIQSSQGEGLFQGLLLDLFIGTIIHNILINMDVDEIQSPQGVLLLVINSYLSGYLGEGAAQLVARLENILKEEEGQKRTMKLYAVIQMIERRIKEDLSNAASEYQDAAVQIGAALGLNPQSDQVLDFSLNLFRESTFHLMSIAVDSLRQQIQEDLGLTEWQTVVEGTMMGTMRFKKSTDDFSDIQPSDILVMERLPPEFPIREVAGFIVFESDALTAHNVNRALQNGIPFFVCPKRKMIEGLDGQSVVIEGREDRVTIEQGTVSMKSKPLVKKAAVQIPKPVVSSEMFLLPENYEAGTGGMKAFNLMKLESRGDHRRRTKHMALSGGFYDKVLNHRLNKSKKTNMDALQIKLGEMRGVADRRIVGESLAQRRQIIESLEIPKEMIEEASRRIREQIPTGRVFLRSSSNAEDLTGYSGAGLYDSFGAIDPDNLEELSSTIKKILASLWNDRAYEDRAYHQIDDQEFFMAVLAQEMFDSKYSYVVHTNGSSTHEMILEIVQGLGEGLVSGEYKGTPHRFIYDKRTGVITRTAFSSKDFQLVLQDGELKRIPTEYKEDMFQQKEPMGLLHGIFEEALTVEKYFDGRAQDIEGCIVESPANLDGETILVQSRDQNKDAAMSSSARTGRIAQPVEVNQTETGGIDLTSNQFLKTQNAGQDIKFHLDPAMLKQLQNASGFTPVIINIKPLVNLREFLGMGLQAPAVVGTELIK